MRQKINYNEYMKRNKLYQVKTDKRTLIGVINPVNTNHETLCMFEQGTFEECKFPVEDILKVTEIWD